MHMQELVGLHIGPKELLMQNSEWSSFIQKE